MNKFHQKQRVENPLFQIKNDENNDERIMLPSDS